MDNTVSDHLLRVSSGYIELPQPLEIGADVTLTLHGSVVKTEDRDNQDGTVQRIYTVKGMIVELQE